MIRLIASDVDGTLIQDDSQRLHPQLCSMIRQLKEMGIIFAVASGRQYPNLYRLFEPVQDDIIYICENGCLVKYRGETLYKAEMPEELALEIMNKIWEKDTAEILLSGENTSYIQPKSQHFRHLLVDVVKNNVTEVEDIFQLREPAFKISVFEEEGIEATQKYWRDVFYGKVTAVTSGREWLDFTPIGAHKGNALKEVQKRLHIAPDDCMAFGDEYNDIEMLENVRYSYAMETSKPGVKAVSSAIVARVEPVLEHIIKKGSWEDQV